VIDAHAVLPGFSRSDLLCREHEDRDIFCGRVLPDLFKGLPPVHRLHHDVKEDQVWNHGLEDRKTLFPTIGTDGCVLFTGKNSRKSIHDEWAIVDNQDSRIHTKSPLSVDFKAGISITPAAGSQCRITITWGQYYSNVYWCCSLSTSVNHHWIFPASSPLICRSRASWNLMLVSMFFNAREISSLIRTFESLKL